MERSDKLFAGNGAAAPLAPPVAHARFAIGDVVRHRLFDFRGVIFDVDPVFANSDEWYEAIPEDIRPPKDQPFYHLLADESDEPVDHPAISGLFDTISRGRYRLKREHRH